MRCIFCKSDSSNSKTIEHTVPESLGNIEHVLPAGVICDKCNNYFACEVEKPLMESDYFVQLRFWKDVQSKKGIVPSIKGVHVQTNKVVGLSKNSDGIGLYAFRSSDEEELIHHLQDAQKGTLLVPLQEKAEDYLMARFLGKVALEAMAQRVLAVDGGLDEITDKKELDILRNYVRRGHPQKKVWIFHERRLYSMNAIFYESGYGSFDVLHEYTFLYTDAQEIYFVMALFGIEYTINMGGAEIDSYIEWLKQNDNKSPLYP
jgi:hypothetical protein